MLHHWKWYDSVIVSLCSRFFLSWGFSCLSQVGLYSNLILISYQGAKGFPFPHDVLASMWLAMTGSLCYEVKLNYCYRLLCTLLTMIIIGTFILHRWRAQHIICMVCMWTIGLDHGESTYLAINTTASQSCIHVWPVGLGWISSVRVSSCFERFL